MSAEPLRVAMRRFWREQGWLVAGDVQQCNKRLMARLGARAAEFEQTGMAVVMGRAPLHAIYPFAQDVEMANLLMSRQAPESLAAAAWLYESAQPYLEPGAVVADLGCWSGTLLAYLATQHPDVHGIGIDREDAFYDDLLERYANLDIAWVTWDYETPPPEWLPPCDVLLTSFGLETPLRLREEHKPNEDLTQRKSYQEDYAEAALALAHWRAIAQEDAPLFAVLRLGVPEHLTAVLAAATSNGWRWDRAASTMLGVGKDRYPALAFRAGAPGEAPRWDAVVEFMQR